jgi:hypothetical protein
VNLRGADSQALQVITTVPVLAPTNIPINYNRASDNVLKTKTYNLPATRKTLESNTPVFPDLPNNPPSYDIEITMNPSSPEITIKPPNTVTMHIIRNLNNQSQCGEGKLGVNCIFACVKQGLNIIPHPSRSGQANIYERLRNEYLTNTITGQYYLQMYDSNFSDVRDAMFSEATSAWKFLSLFNTWEPAIDNLLNGDGSYKITSDMTQVLNEVLDIIDRNVSGPFKAQINEARIKMHLFETTNKTILDLMQNEFEPSFIDTIFNNDFE